MNRIASLFLILILLVPSLAMARKKQEEAKPPEEESLLNSSTLGGLALREIGPAIASGRVSDIAVDPRNSKRYFVAIAAGGVWKTENAATTWEPVFDQEGSSSIGCVTLDPNNPHIVWVGTGENNSQRSVGYGDGVYKSEDGGKSWSHMGLKDSEHIAKIIVDPGNSDTVYVASQGPLWSAGGDRGLFKSVDGGVSWDSILPVGEHTGVTDLVMDPRDANVLYAATYQRRRRVWTLVNGGPESGLHKTTDGGATWTQLESGLPTVEMGRIGLVISPANPDVLYAIIEAQHDAGGFFRSVDRGASWELRGPYVSGSPQYYQELVADPKNVDRVYSMDTWMQVTEDGGATFKSVGEYNKHVDNHAMWINPQDTDHLIAGCDGGVYESYDRAATWHFKPNLPVTQFYKVGLDNDEPFYNVYGGTQDNFSIGGPSRTIQQHGITNREWFFTLGGDGFQTRVDPENPDIIYSQSQYANLNRFDRKTGEVIDVQPQAEPGDDPLRWNWDSPLIISPHSRTRLYFAAQRVFRSDDRGDHWTPVSDDLTQQIDRNQLQVMGTVWSVDAVAKNRSTSPYGNVVSLAESPRVEGLLYAGTDDGLVQVLEPGADSWRKIESFPGIPKQSYVDHIETSWHDDNTVYVAWNDHKSGNFKPYILKSIDRGATWTSIVGNLPERGSVYSVVEDPGKAGLLFVGTEFGVFFTLDGSTEDAHWVQLKGGIPVVAVRDLAIQHRENDLVAATFGRGFFILDDYTPLRQMSEESLEAAAQLFSVKRTWAYIESYPLGLRGNAHQGDGFYAAANPPFGATFTYYLKDGLKSRAETRQAAEKEAAEAGESVQYPSWDDLRAEDREDDPAIILTVADRDGHVVRRLEGPTAAGIHRVTWDLRFPSQDPVNLEPFSWENPFTEPPRGPMAVPGSYQVTLAQRVDGVLEALGEPQNFEVVPLGAASLPAADREALLVFQRKAARLARAVLGALSTAAEVQGRLDHLLIARRDTPAATEDHRRRLRDIGLRLADALVVLEGDATVASRSEPVAPSIVGRVDQIVRSSWVSTSTPTGTQRRGYDIASEAFGGILEKLRVLVEQDLAVLEDDLEAAGAPWTPGRLPQWEVE
jgi:photosystem II stability/assembly factor-like uncharacterized protein